MSACNKNTHTDDVVTLTPVSLSVNEGENSNLTCSPVSNAFFSPILNTIPVGSDEAELLIPPRDEITFTDTGDARVFTWLAASLADHGRQFFCQLDFSTSNRATLYINRESLSLPISLIHTFSLSLSHTHTYTHTQSLTHSSFSLLHHRTCYPQH